jgi:FixJ family two-component response regulator
MIHVVDPDDSIGEALSALLETYQIAVRTYADAESFLKTDYIQNLDSSCLLIETSLPGLSGLSLLRELRDRHCKFPVIMLTDIASSEILAQARRLGATDVLEKPLMSSFLLDRLRVIFPGKPNPTPPLASTIDLPDGTRVTLRAMRPEDSDLEQAFVKGLSKRSSRLRFLSAIKELTPDMLERFTHPEFPGSYALIATTLESDKERQIGVARYMPTGVNSVAEFAVVVADKWQGLGLATYLLSGLTTTAAVAGITQLEGLVLNDNAAMLRLMKKLGFSVTRCSDDATLVRVVKTLNDGTNTMDTCN